MTGTKCSTEHERRRKHLLRERPLTEPMVLLKYYLKYDQDDVDIHPDQYDPDDIHHDIILKG